MLLINNQLLKNVNHFSLIINKHKLIVFKFGQFALAINKAPFAPIELLSYKNMT